MEIEGMIIRDLGLLEGVSKAGNPWKKHEWVLETLGQYPRKVKFTVFGDRVNTIFFELGKSYAIQVDVESREFNDRWYTDLTAYGFRPLESQQGPVDNTSFGGQPGAQNIYGGQNIAPQNPYAQQPAQQPNPFGAPSVPDFSQGDNSEDLPF